MKEDYIQRLEDDFKSNNVIPHNRQSRFDIEKGVNEFCAELTDFAIKKMNKEDKLLTKANEEGNPDSVAYATKMQLYSLLVDILHEELGYETRLDIIDRLC